MNVPTRDIERFEPFGDVYFAFEASGRLVGALRRVGNGTNRGKYVGRPEMDERRLVVEGRIARVNEYARNVHFKKRNSGKK